MKTEKIQMTFDIEGNEEKKEIGLAYCYATEIAFFDYSGQNFDEFIREANAGGHFDSKRILYTILAAVMAYYQSRGEDAPIVDSDLMYHARPESVVAAFSKVLQLYAAWYKMPEGDQPDKPSEDEPKNAKTPATSIN